MIETPVTELVETPVPASAPASETDASRNDSPSASIPSQKVVGTPTLTVVPPPTIDDLTGGPAKKASYDLDPEITQRVIDNNKKRDAIQATLNMAMELTQRAMIPLEEERDGIRRDIESTTGFDSAKQHQFVDNFTRLVEV